MKSRVSALQKLMNFFNGRNTSRSEASGHGLAIDDSSGQLPSYEGCRAYDSSWRGHGLHMKKNWRFRQKFRVRDLRFDPWKMKTRVSALQKVLNFFWTKYFTIGSSRPRSFNWRLLRPVAFEWRLQSLRLVLERSWTSHEQKNWGNPFTLHSYWN